MSQGLKNIAKQYEAGSVEGRIYKMWEESGYFNPDNLKLPESAKSFCIVLPPPNITDKLHLGHAAMVAIEDVMIRYARMSGYRALWIPGTDHAAIATQNVVEKRLQKEEGKTRHDLGKEKFLEHVWKFLYETQSMIQKQIRNMGGSLDWSREAFTLDKPRAKAVSEMFCRMYGEGVIYRGHRIVNWCPRCESTLADDEIEYKEKEEKLYWIKYGPFVLATSRPETKLGDTAVAVHPDDPRYKEWIGKTVKISGVLGEFEVKVVADEVVDPKFGSGIIKVTPAHSFVDFEIGLRHQLPVKAVINEKGRMMENCGKYAGMTVAECREAIVADMEAMGIMDRVEDYTHNLSVCYRCSTAIEPLVSKQWFISVDKKLDRLGGKSLKEKALEAAKSDEIRFVPERFTKRYSNWMENLHDWCISRQIWFGHPIPVWYCQDCKEMTCARDEKLSECPSCHGSKLTQDPDSLDTWFSSGTWTFSTLGWPDNQDSKGNKTGDLAKFHPTSVLETGYEIITLWVSRMVMMSFFALGEIPFNTVYLHGLILDAQGKKMSKSKGNGIDPLDMIPKYGTDALRLSILLGNTPGTDMKFSEEKIDAAKRFVNKLWNISRYILTSIDLEKAKKTDIKSLVLTTADRWIIARSNEMIALSRECLDIEGRNYKISMLGEALREYTWSDLADWYVEIAKVEGQKDAILYHLLEILLRLWHPFIPFVSEEIWSNLAQKDPLIVSEWPKLLDIGEVENSRSQIEKIKDTVTAIRNIRAENKVDAGAFIKVKIASPSFGSLINSYREVIGKLARVEELEMVEALGEKMAGQFPFILDGVEGYVSVAVEDSGKSKEKLEKELSHYQILLENVRRKIDNVEFTSKAPEAVVAKEKEKAKEYRDIIEKIKTRL
ncbi:MAG: valyl-tRNA synthetase [Parcubacteria group bacterium Gr01-1014_18]|nr:MAG: valyl-tRNA synthetase [Parcubacteria group bacterium Greene0416_36]TSC81048.1 MAG: valyl-tRNA synthetase [Parcubacteria group bacterium Gr01-1014_18]TSC98782.1 MAG: valyl-tRNA synthetase [Parcubacteria group bacterium Greene1014_20]TSD06738.1 MAG: valyl-tRNA synthetase [Parcubacteria group bacterium Greene0714_2]